MTFPDVEFQVNVLFECFKIADETSAVTTQLLRLMREIPTGGKQVHDANIVATMLANNIPTLITRNVVDFHRFAQHISIVALS